jgi:hypothetical protein
MVMRPEATRLGVELRVDGVGGTVRHYATVV